jgi:DhnA family fructose-bisphosphate aldolase class Ia
MIEMGKYLRQSRLFDQKSGTSIIIPMDHSVEDAGYKELEDPRSLVAALVDAGVNGFILRRGLARFAAPAFAGRAGWVQRITGRSGMAHADIDQLVLASVEEALHNGADAVVPTFFLGGETERQHLPLLGKISDECNKLGIPLMAEVFPTGGPDAIPYDGPYSIEDMRIAVRIASEEGADMIKTWYTGDPSSFSKVVAYSTIPILIAGGPKARNDREVLEMVKGAMDGGAKGLTMGRKIWQSSNPPALVRAISMIVREGASVAHAMEALAVAR